jgi:hypothetical protein
MRLDHDLVAGGCLRSQTTPKLAYTRIATVQNAAGYEEEWC